MKIKIAKIIPCCDDKDCPECTVTFSINGRKYSALGLYFDVHIGSEVEVEFDVWPDEIGWEEMFQRNIKKEKGLIPVGEYSYEAYGQIVSINPIIADFGDVKLQLWEFSHDERIIGEFIYFKINRLDVSLKDS